MIISCFVIFKLDFFRTNLSANIIVTTIYELSHWIKFL